MSYRWLISTVVILIICNVYHAQVHKRMKFFIGTWQYENLPGFEVWTINGNEIAGQGYRIKNGKDTVLIETMRVVMESNKLVLYARVGSENDGKEIRFEESKSRKYKFVNESHDFPKSIYYHFRKFRRKRVQVLLNHPHKDTHTKPIVMRKMR